MAVVGTAQLLRTTPTGSVTVGGVTNYTTHHLVTVDSANDGIDVVAAAIGTPGTSTYSVGSESNANAVLKQITPKRRKNAILLWDVRSTWGPLDESDQQITGRDDDGNATDDPLAMHHEVDVDYMWRSKSLWRAVNDEAFGDPLRDAGKLGPISNSCHQILDPPTQVEYPVMIVRITAYKTAFPMNDAKKYTDAVNTDNWSYRNRFYNFTVTGKPGEVWCQGITGPHMVVNGVALAKITYTFAINTEKWLLEIPDLGFSTVKPEPTVNPDGTVNKNVPQLEIIKDQYDYPIRNPARLNGFGGLLDRAFIGDKLLKYRVPTKRENFTDLKIYLGNG